MTTFQTIYASGINSNDNCCNGPLTITSITKEGHKVAEGKDAFEELKPLEMREIMIESTESSSVLVLMYLQMIFGFTSSLKITLSKSVDSFEIEGFLSTQDKPQVTKNGNVITVTGLFEDGVQGTGGAIYVNTYK